MYTYVRMAFALCITLLCVTQAPAAPAGPAGYAVAPFVVNGPAGFSYLQKAVPSMLSSRLYWKGHFEPIAETSRLSAVANAQSAKGMLASSGADYLVWGDVNIIGQEALVSTKVLGKNGKTWHRESKTTVNNLISSLQGTADHINAELFGRVAMAPGAAAGTAAGPLNPNMVQNQTAGNVYLNPQIRYQGADGARLRSQHLPFMSVGMEIGDFDGDGRNEIALLTTKKVYLYRWTDKLDQIAEYALPRTQIALTIRSLDVNRDRVPELIISSVGVDTTIASSTSSMASLFTEPDKAYGYVLSCKGGKIRPFCKPVHYYLGVAQLPPDYRPILVGQRGDLNSGFDRSGVREMNWDGSTFTLGRKISTPKDSNLLSFVYMPSQGGKDQGAVVNLNHNEKLQVFSPTNLKDAIYTSSDSFSGAPSALECPSSLPGMGKDYSVSPVMVYMPMRMLVTDLDRNHQLELLVNKPISIAAQFFSSYRDYPEGEIHALSWDGVGLNLLWKTRRIKGTVADFGLTDANNDGTQDLIVCLNTHTGALGLKNSRTVLVAYPLDLEHADPNTPPVRE